MAVLLRELKVVAEIAELHRSLPDVTPSSFTSSSLDPSAALETATVANGPVDRSLIVPGTVVAAEGGGRSWVRG